MCKIAIVNSSSFGRVYPEHISKLEKFAQIDQITVDLDITPEDFINKLKSYDGIIASTNPNYPPDLLNNLPNLKIIARHGIGFNNIDLNSAEKLGIIVTKVAGPVERNSVAEHAVALMLSAARWIPQGHIASRSNLWKSRANFIGKELTNKTIGIIGYGNIGSRTAEILESAFQANILIHDPQHTESVALEQLLQGSDFISMHAALTENNYHMLGKKEFLLMKPGMILVNSARGELIDDSAIIPFLESKHIRAYAADVVEGEPIDDKHPLLKLDNTIIVPHLGGYSDESSKGMGDTMVESMQMVFQEKKIPTKHLVPGLKYSHIRQ